MGPRQRRLLVPEQWLVPGRETHGGWAEDRNMDRHDMQGEVECLFRGLWRRRSEGGTEKDR